MIVYKFTSFQVSVIEQDIAEIVVFDNTEFDITMVNEFHELVRNQMNPQVSVLVNKNHSYSYTFGALVALSRSQIIKSVAVWSNNGITKSTTSYLAKRFNFYKIPVKSFCKRDDALKWLRDMNISKV